MIDRHTLYLDNFRGFKDAYVPVADVNFLVGENSSGKTSILNLLKLMSGERLLFDNQFNTEDLNLGTFDEIVSAQTDDASYFRIGMLRHDSASDLPLAMLITYAKHEALPRDSRFTCTFGRKELAVRRVGDDIFFRVRDNAITPNTEPRRLMERWVEDHDSNDGDFKRMNSPFSSEQSLLFPLSLVARESTAVGKTAKRFRMLSPTVFPSLVWIAPIRTKPLRTYDQVNHVFSAEGVHTPYVIRKMLDSESQAIRFRNRIRRVGLNSGLFSEIDIKRFGDDISDPFQVRIVLDSKSFNMTSVGYGVSQALPVVVEVLCRPPNTWFAVQQPEVHLHPRAQSALGELVFGAAASERKGFLIETHSDFMVDRYLFCMRSRRGRKPPSQVIFFERVNRKNTATTLVLSDSGELPAKQPRSYRAFFLREAMKNLAI